MSKKGINAQASLRRESETLSEPDWAGKHIRQSGVGLGRNRTKRVRNRDGVRSRIGQAYGGVLARPAE